MCICLLTFFLIYLQKRTDGHENAIPAEHESNRDNDCACKKIVGISFQINYPTF